VNRFEEVIAELGELLARHDPDGNRLAGGRAVELLREIEAHAPERDGAPVPERWQDRLIIDTIPPGSRVLDLGCGDGELLAHLAEEKGVVGQGVEVDPTAVLRCVERGVPVFQTDMDEGLSSFPRGSFDYVVLEETLQTLHHPVRVLEQMLHVGRHSIVSFPNFGYWKVRLDLLVRGRMPISGHLPHAWYETPNIHLFSLLDFFDWTRESGIRVVESWVLNDTEIREMRESDHLYAQEALLVLERP